MIFWRCFLGNTSFALHKKNTIYIKVTNWISKQKSINVISPWINQFFSEDHYFTVTSNRWQSANCCWQVVLLTYCIWWLTAIGEGITAPHYCSQLITIRNPPTLVGYSGKKDLPFFTLHPQCPVLTSIHDSYPYII